MKHYWIIIILIISCNGKSTTDQASNAKNTNGISSAETTSDSKNVWTNAYNGKTYPLPDTIGNKPANFYLENPKVENLAKAFYLGRFTPSDNDSTSKLLSYVTTNDSIIRPFYRWCLDLTITISDGALAEYPGEPALAYATKYPKEFFDFMDEDKSGLRYKDWVELIAYGGLGNPDQTESEIENKIIKNMGNSCRFCDESINARIATFAKDISKSAKEQELVAGKD